tara:strand:+ start:1644 stop:1853 length:210 start_codon:yes stop_codon:yes gene_type:complete
MGNKICCNICVKKEEEEEREIKDVTKYGDCSFCKRTEICTYHNVGNYGTTPIMMCINCEIDLNRKLLYN